MKTIEDKIKAFSTDPEKILAAQAIVKVGFDKGDHPDRIFQILLGHILFDFHGIPFKPTE